MQLPWTIDDVAEPARRADVCAALLARPRRYVCHRVPRGEVDWSDIPDSELFVDIEGDGRPTPRHETRVRMAFNDEALHIRATLTEPHVWGSITRRNEVIFHDNDFEVFLDPDGDNHNYYELEINALGTLWELSLPMPYRTGAQPRNPDMLDGLRAEVDIDGTVNDPSDVDRGWSVELALPFASLARFTGERSCPPRDGDQWRMNFSRVQWEHEVVDGAYRKIAGVAESNWVWSAQGVVDMHRPATWGVVQFSDAEAGESVAWREDRTQAARNYLMAVWECQHERTVATSDVTALGLPRPPWPVVIDVHEGGWRARAALSGAVVEVDHLARLRVV